MRRYFIYLGYNGKNFRGWQIQPNGMTVQQSIEEALAILMRKPVPIVGAGRTDAGVHARLMIHEPINIILRPGKIRLIMSWFISFPVVWISRR